MGTSLPEELSNSVVGNLTSKVELQVSPVFHKLSLLQPLKAPKSYGTYSKQQQEEVIAFIKDGNSLRTAEKYFGIPKSTMHCWLKKGNTKYNQSLDVDTCSMVNNNNNNNNCIDDKEELNVLGTRKSPLMKSPPRSFFSSTSHNNDNNNNNSKTTNTQSVTQQLSSTTTNTTGTTTKKKGETQIIIEEAELIRFLQTSEGAELIGKAYNLPVAEFLNFVKNTQFVKRKVPPKQPAKTDDMVSLLKQSGGENVKEEANKMNTSPYPFSSMRKRNFNNSGCKCQLTPFSKTVNTELKKPKLDNTHVDTCTSNHNNNINNNTKNEGVLKSLLTKPRDRLNAPPLIEKSPLVLTEEQIKTSNKLISQAQPSAVNTYLVTVPLNSLPNTLSPISKPSDDIEECELSPTYPKMVNPLSIKSERVDNDCMMRPPGPLPFVAKNSGVMATLPRMQTLINQATKAVVSTNAKAALNLNVINRSQSERELMALVDGDVVSADELCTDFNETLELNKWVHNENWYTDQYLQHFQIPTTSTPFTSDATATAETTDTGEKCVDEFEEEEDDDDDGGGITFASVNDKDKIVSYLSEGNSITDAVNHFEIPQTTITRWLGSVDKKKQEEKKNCNSIEKEGDIDMEEQDHKSAFSFLNNKPTTGKSSVDSRKSAFSRPFN